MQKATIIGDDRWVDDIGWEECPLSPNVFFERRLPAGPVFWFATLRNPWEQLFYDSHGYDFLKRFYGLFHVELASKSK